MYRSFQSTALLVSAMAFACIAADAPAAKAAPAAPAAPVASSAPAASTAPAAAAPATAKAESSVKIVPATPAAAPAKAVAAAPAASAGTPCEEVKASIDAKLKAKGVTSFTLDIVAKEDVKDAKVVGSCEAGSKKITYKRG